MNNIKIKVKNETQTLDARQVYSIYQLHKSLVSEECICEIMQKHENIIPEATSLILEKIEECESDNFMDAESFNSKKNELMIHEFCKLDPDIEDLVEDYSKSEEDIFILCRIFIEVTEELYEELDDIIEQMEEDAYKEQMDEEAEEDEYMDIDMEE